MNNWNLRSPMLMPNRPDRSNRRGHPRATHADDTTSLPEPPPTTPTIPDDHMGLGWFWDPDQSTWKLAKISEKDRALHCYVIGASGSGKTKFLEFCIKQDIERGNGFGVIDPHGDLTEDIKGFLACYPKEHGNEIFDRVIIIDPTARNNVAFNLLEQLPGVTPTDQAHELLSAFKRIWEDSWGPRMEDLLRNSLIALGEAGLTFVDFPEFLASAGFRSQVLNRVSHPIARAYFERFESLSNRDKLTWSEPVSNKINAFLSDERIRQMLAHRRSSFNLRNIMDHKKILLVKLDKGKLRESADLLGSLLMAKIQMAAFSRSDTPESQRVPFYLYIDEFQNFATDSFAVVLSEARKYGLSLTMAHQTLAQVPPDLRSILLGNTGIQVYFRINRQDAEILAKESFTYSGYDVKLASLRGPKLWSLGEEWERYFEELQTLHPRHCYVKHKIQGGMIPLQTCTIQSPWEVLGMEEEEYREYLANLTLGKKYVIERATLGRGDGSMQKQVAAVSEAEVTSQDSRKDTDPPKTARKINTSIAERLEASRPPPRAVPREVGGAPVSKEIVTYLEHIAGHPFLPALQRDTALELTRYKGSLLRQHLVEAGFMRLHKVGTGTRSGQLTLQEITGAGYELLASMKIKVHKPKGRGGFLHKYYCHRIADFARASWPESVVGIEDGSMGKFADVTVKTPGGADGQKQRVIAFEVFMTGVSKEVRGIEKGIEVFDLVVVCAESTEALQALKRKTAEVMGLDRMEKVRFNLLSQYVGGGIERDSSAVGGNRTQKKKSGGTRPASEVERRGAPVHGASGAKRGRKSKVPLMQQVEEAYAHLHDMDWLQECDLTKLTAVQERIQPRQAMPEAQALRGFLIAAARDVIGAVGQVPGKEGVGRFLDKYLEGMQVAEIARELGVSREWCSRNYRREALRLAGLQFVRTISHQTQQASESEM